MCVGGGIHWAATIRDVAALAGLSIGTVSKYINGQTVKASTQYAIEDAIFCTSMISSIESRLLPKGYSVIVCECHNDAKMELFIS